MNDDNDNVIPENNVELDLPQCSTATRDKYKKYRNEYDNNEQSSSVVSLTIDNKGSENFKCNVIFSTMNRQDSNFKAETVDNDPSVTQSMNVHASVSRDTTTTRVSTTTATVMNTGAACTLPTEVRQNTSIYARSNPASSNTLPIIRQVPREVRSKRNEQLKTKTLPTDHKQIMKSFKRSFCFVFA